MKKLHIGVDENGWILASKVTDGHEHDASQVPSLLAQVNREIDRFVGDRIFDQERVYEAVALHSPGAELAVQPRKDAVLSAVGWLKAKNYEAQKREAAIGCAILNRMLEMGEPLSYAIG